MAAVTLSVLVAAALPAASPARAKGGSGEMINACIKKTVSGNGWLGVRGRFRFVTKPRCRPNEFLIQWSASASQGLRGPVGPRGPRGPQGPEGAQGATGEAGPTGAVGPQGIEGVAGPQGPAGPAGPIGPQGIPGPIGPEGDPGPSGAIGPIGPQGPAGSAGVEGPQGPAGPDGSEGPAGVEGPQGPAGPEGAEGPQGPAGADGPEGPQGPAGPSGTADTEVVTAFTKDGSPIDVKCPEKKPVAISGGASITDIADPKDPTVRLLTSAPIKAGDLAPSGAVADGWRAQSVGDTERTTTVYVICVPG